MTAAAIKATRSRGLSSRERIERGSIPIPFSGCWIWLGYENTGGYGRIKINRKMLMPHRVSWIVYNGEIPAGIDVLHKCDVRLCVNPDHLFLGTDTDNARDREQKGRGNHVAGDRNGTHTRPDKVSRGESHGMSKLSHDDIRKIRGSSANSTVLSKHFGVAVSTIRRIIRRQIWGHV